jgi:hypothetical protein
MRFLPTPLIATLLLCTVASPARSEPVVVKPGKVVLPMSGLEIELPKDSRKGHTWSVSGSYALDDAFDSRDVIDEKVDGKLVAGSWVLVGYFSAGDCEATVAGTTLESPWTAKQDLWGQKWSIRGGIFTFEGDLGKVPAVVLCTTRPDRKSLLLYRFFLDLPTTTAQADLQTKLAKLPMLARVTKSWASDRVSNTPPLRRPEVRNRGKLEAVRTVALEVTSLALTMPDDGYVWVPRAHGENDDPVDWLDRMAPAVPEIDIEIAKLPNVTCQAFAENLEAPRAKGFRSSHVPEGWTVGPVLEVTGTPEYTVCREIKGNAIVVGMFNLPIKGPTAGDFTPVAPMLEAIARAASM